MNLKSFEKRPRLVVQLSLVLMLLLIPGLSPAGIYINNIPEDIIITEGYPIDIPVFFVAEDLTGQAVDLYVWKVDLDGTNLQCLTDHGWIPITDISQRMPLIQGFSPMMEYLYIVWPAFESSTGMNSFKLYLCLTGKVNDSPKEICGQRIINILPPSQGISHTVTAVVSEGNGTITPTSQTVSHGSVAQVTATADPGYHVANITGCGINYSNSSDSVNSHTETTAPVTSDCTVTATFKPNQSSNCGGLSLSNTSYSETLRRGETKTIDIFVKDSCNNVINFVATTATPWLSLTKEMGILHVTLQTSSLAANNTYKGEINVNANGQSKAISISLTVTAPTIPLPGGGGCTASSLNLWPVTITASAGETKTQSVSVTNNCGSPVSYTATVTKGNSWLSAPSSGSGTMVITINTTGLSAGTYSGQIKVTSGSLTGYIDVNLTVSGPCVASRAVIDPPSITKNILTGEQAGSVSVTVRDNCGKSLDYSVDGITYTTGSVGWITAPSQGYKGNGSLSISFSTTNLQAGNYEASIVLTPSGYSQTAIKITLNVSSSTPPPSNITRLTDNTRVRIKLQSKQYAYFYFMTASLDPNDLNAYTHSLTKTDVLEVRLEPYANDYLGGDMLIRYAGQTCDGKLPTLDELIYTFTNRGSWQPIWQVYKDPPYWYPARWRDDLYYYQNPSGAFETPQIGGYPHYPLGCWYILVYNDDRYNQGMTDLYISFREYAAKYHGPGY
ncbi:MAG: hypothetical protein QW561_04670 [Candidatus Aenigmatarchaeota archaeon]